ncbi:unnamed protein product [Diabrotica balteata]|uniref:Uncharacterized protein n=1 Tax=Diabrotica balteata TaxID=107213 RepID=A0A9N9T341_DIABA|nr:unnamed protein product [Diabrotica balteata]
MNHYCLSVFLVALAVVGVVLSAPEKSFEENLTIFRKVNVDDVLKSDRLVKNYVDCMIGSKSCTAEGAALKAIWRKILDDPCKETCSQEDKRKVQKCIKHLYVNHRNWYDELETTLINDEEYQKRYKTYLDAILKDDTL